MTESATSMVDRISAAERDALHALEQITTGSELKMALAKHCGKVSPIAALSAEMGATPVADRAEIGRILGASRKRIANAFQVKQERLEQAERANRLADEAIDVTALPSRWRQGGRHPISLLQEQIRRIFVGMSWDVAEGPELEHAWFNFDALNTDIDHPARSMQDTFYIEPAEANLVLRTQTSPVQVRSMLSQEPPIYVIAPGRVYRSDEFDATHLPVFHQVEGLAVDKGLNMANLKGTLEHFARIMFGPEAKIRFRPNFFPFTEPSAELDLWHPTFKGGPRWIEWGGCGMVHPNVLRAAGIDPEHYKGFAFGMGLERTLMFRNGVTDMRDIAEGDVRFSRQMGVRV